MERACGAQRILFTLGDARIFAEQHAHEKRCQRFGHAERLRDDVLSLRRTIQCPVRRRAETPPNTTPNTNAAVPTSTHMPKGTCSSPDTNDGIDVGVGKGVSVGTRVGQGVADAVAVSVGVDVEVAASVGDGLGVVVTVGVGVGLATAADIARKSAGFAAGVTTGAAMSEGADATDGATTLPVRNAAANSRVRFR